MLNKYHIKQYNSSLNRKGLKRICYAPYTSLRFSQSGNIISCCYNRGYILGKYPENTIKEVWNSKELKKLKKNLKKNNFDLGCDICKDRILNKTFTFTGALHYDYLHHYYKSKYPAMLDFEISNTCNLECVMCTGENSSSIRTNRENLSCLSPIYDNNFIKQLEEFIPHIKEARFSGGEPFLIKMYYEIWELIIRLNPKAKITILTNSTILNEKIKDLLDKGNFTIAVSIDSFTKSTYEKIRQNASFDSVVENMKYFYEYSIKHNNPFFINLCPMPYNWKEIPEIIKICNSKNIKLIFHTILFPPKESLWALSSKELVEIANFYDSFDFIANSEIEFFNYSNFLNLKEQIKTWHSESIDREIKNKLLSSLSYEELLLAFQKHLGENNNDFYQQIMQLINDFDIKKRERIINRLFFFHKEALVSELKHNNTERLLIKLSMFDY